LKRIAIILSTIIFGLLLNSQLAHAEIYKWADEKGTVHFTEDPATIPEKYRAKTKSRQTEEDLMSPEEKAKAKIDHERDLKERARREQEAYEKSLAEEQLRKKRRELEDTKEEECLRAEKEEKARRLEESGKEPTPEYVEIPCSRCNGTGIIWKKTKTPKTISRTTFWEEGPQIATKCPDCNGKGFTISRVK